MTDSHSANISTLAFCAICLVLLALRLASEGWQISRAEKEPGGDGLRQLLVEYKKQKKSFSSGEALMRKLALKGDAALLHDAIEDYAEVTRFSERDFSKGILAAALAGNLGCLRVLLQKKPALLNHLIDKYRTPLMQAAAHGHMDCVKYLIEVGAKCNLVCNSMSNAADFARQYGHNDIAKVIDAHMDDY